MAQQDITIGVANEGNGDTLFAAFTKVQANFDELYSDDTGDVRGIVGTAPIAAGIASQVATVSLNDLGVTTAKLANDAVTYGKLGAEFTTTDAVTTELAFDDHQVFTKTMTTNTTFTFTGANIGMVKDFVLTGDFVPTFPVGTKTVAGTYDGTVSNLIQIVAVADGDYWLSISQAQ